jgi:hypothetical protein
MAIKHAGDNEVRAADRLKHAGSSTPTLQRWLESPQGVVLMLMVGLAIFGLAACGEFTPRPDLRTSTLTAPDNGDHCAHGYKTRQTGNVGAYGTPVVEVTDLPCKAKP